MRKLLVAASALILVAACGSGGKTSAPTPSPASVPHPASLTPSAATVTPTSGTSTGGSSPGTPAAPSPSSSHEATFAAVPLWPFASVAAAQQWQREAGAGGHQSWRLDAGAVALAFASQFLGFTEIDRVVRKTVTASDAHVSVGYSVDGAGGTAAVVHLVRIGSGAGQPWEVVGTDDTPTFSLTRPRYGSSVTGTTIAGGHIAGVDESIRVTARQLSGVVGSFCCLPAGAPTSWSVPLSLTNLRPGPVTIAASTGGHLASVERFAVTGVRSRS
jgi:hypothetical protein